MLQPRRVYNFHLTFTSAPWTWTSVRRINCGWIPPQYSWIHPALVLEHSASWEAKEQKAESVGAAALAGCHKTHDPLSFVSMAVELGRRHSYAHTHTPSHHQKSQPCFACATTTILTYKLLLLQCWSEAGTREKENFPCSFSLSLSSHTHAWKNTHAVLMQPLSLSTSFSARSVPVFSQTQLSRGCMQKIHGGIRNLLNFCAPLALLLPRLLHCSDLFRASFWSNHNNRRQGSKRVPYFPNSKRV